MYGGSLRGLAFDEAAPLMLMADKYDVRGLMDVSRRAIIDKLSTENLVRAAILGYLCSDDEVKNAAATKLSRSGKSIKEIEGWEELKKYPELSFEMWDSCIRLGKSR